eukprot:12362151-Alexandrium_andersonii.AAC.1
MCIRDRCCQRCCTVVRSAVFQPGPGTGSKARWPMSSLVGVTPSGLQEWPCLWPGMGCTPLRGALRWTGFWCAGAFRPNGRV